MITVPLPQDIAPLDPDEFFAAYEYAAFVADYEFLEEIPAINNSMIITDVGQLTFTNAFDNLFAFAAARYFDGGDKFLTFMWRVPALLRILEHASMKDYIRECCDHREIHRAVFDVAATQQLSHGYVFDSGIFLKNVREVAARMEAEEARARTRPYEDKER